MGSSWRYPHVAIMPYSIGGSHVLACTFFLSSLVLFTGSHFALMDEPVNSLVGEKLKALIEVNRNTNLKWIWKIHTESMEINWILKELKIVPFHIISTQNGMIKTHWACLNSLYSWVPNKRVECKKVQVGWRINTFLSLCWPFCMLPYLHFFHPTRLFGTREYSGSDAACCLS